MTSEHINIRKLNVVNTAHVKNKLKSSANENSNASEGQFAGDHARVHVQGKIIGNIIERVKNNPISSRIASRNHEHNVTKLADRHSCNLINSQPCNRAVININDMSKTSQPPTSHNLKAKDGEADYEIFSIKSRGHSKFFPAKVTTSKLVQTSSSKLKLRKESKSKQIEELKSQLQAIVSQKDKSKKEIYIITGSHAPFKLDSSSNENAKNYLPLEYKPEGHDPNSKPRQDTEQQKVNRSDGKKLQEEVNVLPMLNRGDLESCEISSGGVACISTASQTRRRKVSLTSSDYINLSEPRKKEKDFPKVISTKLRFKEQRCKRSDSAIGEKHRCAEESGRKHKRAKHREGRRISDFFIGNDVYKKRNIMLDDIETAYLKHKHVLPKEAADALERNIQKWKAMNVDLYKKSSERQSNVLDLGEVLRKNRTNEENMKPLHAINKPNDLILMNAIVTDVNRKKDTMHINKIPKFVRLEGIQEQVMGIESVSNISEGKCPKDHLIMPNDVVCVCPDQEMRLEVSFSHLNVKPVLKVRSSIESQLNSPHTLLPASKSPLENIIPDSQLKALRPNQQTSLVNGGVSFNVDGVEPPKKQKSHIRSAYVAQKKIFSEFKKLEAITLPIMEVRNVHVADCSNPLKSSSKTRRSSRAQSRKKESQKVRKSSKSSSSESTLQLTRILDENADTSSAPDHRNKDELRHLFKSDQDAIAALKYLPPKRREVQDPRGRKLRKTVVSVVEIKPMQLVSSVRSFGGCECTHYDLPMVPSKETELLFKSSDGEESSSNMRREGLNCVVHNDKTGNGNDGIVAGVRSRTMNYSRKTEKMKRSHSVTSREKENVRKISCASEMWSSKCPPSLSGVSTSSGVSLNSDNDNGLPLETTAEHVKLPVEITSVALTKITEETVSQDTIGSSESSVAAKNSVSGKIQKHFGENDSELTVSKRERVKDKVKYISTPSTSRSNQVTALDDRDNKKPKGAGQIKTSVSTPTNASEAKTNHSMSSVRSLQDEEIRRLTESVKNSILNEIQAMNMANMNNLMQLILKTKSSNSISGSSIKLAQSGTSERQTNGKPNRSNSVLREGKKPQCEFKNPFNAHQQVVVVHSCRTTQESDLINPKRVPSTASLGNTSARTRYQQSCSKIPKSIRNPIRRSGSAVRSPGITNNEGQINPLCAKSITSDTKTSLTSAFKETSNVQLAKDGKILSKFEKRKLYDDAIRLKSAKPKKNDVLSNLSVNIENAYKNDGDLRLNNYDQQAELQPQTCTEDDEKVKPSVSKQSSPPMPMQEPEVPKSDERENIYQTFTLMASHPNLTEVFKDKFDKSSFKDTFSSKESSLKKVESIFHYNRRKNNEYDLENSFDVNSNLKKLSRAQIDLLDARKYLKDQPLDRSLVFPKNNLYNMYSQSVSSIESPKNRCYRSRNNAAYTKCNGRERTKDIQRSDSTIQVPTKLEKERGNYLIFKIDQNLQKREASTASESYKIFMNNRVTPDAGASLIVRSKESFLVKDAPLSESGYGSVNGKEDRHLSSTSDLQSKPSPLTILSWTNDNRAYSHGEINNFPGKENHFDEKSSQTDCKHIEKSKRRQGRILRYIPSSYTLKDLILSDSSFHASVADYVKQSVSEDLIRPIIEKSLHNFLSGTEFQNRLQLDTLKFCKRDSLIINTPLETFSDSVPPDPTNQIIKPVTSKFDFSTLNAVQRKCDFKKLSPSTQCAPIRVFLNLTESNHDLTKVREQIEGCDVEGKEVLQKGDSKGSETGKQVCHRLSALDLSERASWFGDVPHLYEKQELKAKDFFTSANLVPSQFDSADSSSTSLSHHKSRSSILSVLKAKLSRIFKVRKKQSTSWIHLLEFPIREPAGNCNHEEFESQLPIIIANAKHWIEQMNSVQGILAQLILCKDALKTTRYFVPLLEAVANNRVTSLIHLYALLKKPESVEIGTIRDSEQIGRLQKRYVNIRNVAEREANLQRKVLGSRALTLLKILAIKFEAVEEYHAIRISKCIGRGLISNEIGLEAAMAYFAKMYIFKDFQN